MLRMKKQ